MGNGASWKKHGVSVVGCTVFQRGQVWRRSSILTAQSNFSQPHRNKTSPPGRPPTPPPQELPPMFRILARRSATLSSRSITTSRTRLAAPHPGIQEPTGLAFGEKQIVGKAGRQWESWEHGYWATCVLGLLFGAVILPARPDTSVKTWSVLEATARSGVEEPELGKSYMTGPGSYVKESVGATPEMMEEWMKHGTVMPWLSLILSFESLFFFVKNWKFVQRVG